MLLLDPVPHHSEHLHYIGPSLAIEVCSEGIPYLGLFLLLDLAGLGRDLGVDLSSRDMLKFRRG